MVCSPADAAGYRARGKAADSAVQQSEPQPERWASRRKEVIAGSPERHRSV